MALLFTTQNAATVAASQIKANMGLGDPGDVTTAWDVPKQDAAGKWVMAKPDAAAMAGVVNYTEGSPVWPADPGMGG